MGDLGTGADEDKELVRAFAAVFLRADQAHPLRPTLMTMLLRPASYNEEPSPTVETPGRTGESTEAVEVHGRWVWNGRGWMWMHNGWVWVEGAGWQWYGVEHQSSAGTAEPSPDPKPEPKAEIERRDEVEPEPKPEVKPQPAMRHEPKPRPVVEAGLKVEVEIEPKAEARSESPQPKPEPEPELEPVRDAQVSPERPSAMAVGARVRVVAAGEYRGAEGVVVALDDPDVLVRLTSSADASDVLRATIEVLHRNEVELLNGGVAAAPRMTTSPKVELPVEWLK